MQAFEKRKALLIVQKGITADVTDMLVRGSEMQTPSSGSGFLFVKFQHEVLLLLVLLFCGPEIAFSLMRHAEAVMREGQVIRGLLVAGCLATTAFGDLEESGEGCQSCVSPALRKLDQAFVLIHGCAVATLLGTII